MDIRDLKLFYHLAETKRFNRTAKEMHVTPSTLSRQIQRLEETLGQALFVRDNRTVELTDAGEHLKVFAQQTLHQYQQLTYTLGQDGEALNGELHLFCSVTAAYSHLPPILDRFRAKHPMVEIKLITGDAADTLDKIQKNEADIGIAGKPDNLPSSIGFTKIGDIPLVLIAPSLPGAIHSQVFTEQPDWSSIPFILPEHGPSRKRIEQWFAYHHISNPMIYASVSGHEAIVPMVALGCGIALIPSVVVEHCPNPIRERIVELDHVSMIKPLELGLCVQKKNLNDPLIHAFWKTLSSQ